MKIILIHIGNDLPEYIWESIGQIKRTNSDTLYLILPTKFHRTIKNCEFIDTEMFLREERNNIFLQRCFFGQYVGKRSAEFWITSTQRFFILESFMKKYNLSNIIHMEYDNTIYVDLETLAQSFITYYKDSIGICGVRANHYSAGFMYIDTVAVLEFLNDNILNILSLPQNVIHKKIGIEFVCDMTLLNYFHKLYPEKIKDLPTIPPMDNKFNSLFDGGPWGMFIGGWDRCHKIGPHYIDPAVITTPWLTKQGSKIIWESDKEQYKVPYFINEGEKIKYRLNNLHMHSKNIKDFI
jgi:hypothetical protein